MHRPHDHVHSRMISIHARACIRPCMILYMEARIRAARCIPGYRECTPRIVVNAYTGCFTRAYARKVLSVSCPLILRRCNAGDSVGLSIKVHRCRDSTTLTLDEANASCATPAGSPRETENIIDRRRLFSLSRKTDQERRCRESHAEVPEKYVGSQAIRVYIFASPVINNAYVLLIVLAALSVLIAN